jgi:DNA polymerase
VKRAMSGDEGSLDEIGREALTIREQTSKSAVRKYTAIADTVSFDDRLRHQFSFMGAARTGRYASHGINVQNLPRPTKHVEKNMGRALELVRSADVKALISEFKNPLEVVTSTLRSSFRASEGNKLVVCDLNAVENRVIGFLARCPAILRVFYENRCPYLDFAVEMYNRTYEDLYHEWKVLGDSTTRSNAKPATLGCGFRLSGGEEKVDENGDKILTGLMGYANAMGVKMSKEEADRAVSIFRKRYPEVVQLWHDSDAAALAAIENPGSWFGIGNPVNDKDRAKYLRNGRDPDLEPILSFRCTGKSVLELKLPSGRCLHYLSPRIGLTEREGSNGTYMKKSWSYEGRDQKSRAWTRVETQGGKTVENATQAVARDLLIHGMLLADEEGASIVLHVHDEIVCEVPTDSAFGIADLRRNMSTPPSWTKGELPLGAEGYEDTTYRKG